MAARAITKLKIILFLISALLFVGFFLPQKVNAEVRVMDVSLNAYFVDGDKTCSGARKTNINETGEKTLNLCVSGPNYESWGFDFNVACGGVVECVDYVREGSDVALFSQGASGISIENKFEKSGDGNIVATYFRGGMPNPVSVNTPLNLAKIKVNVTSLEAGKVSFRKKDVFLNDQRDQIANVAGVEVETGAAAAPDPHPTSVPPFSGYDSDQIPEGAWIQNADVTFAGKMASRSASFLSLAIDKYKWSELTSAGTNPFTAFWRNILNIVYAFALGLVLISAFVMIWTRGRSITIMRFIPRFIFILLLATFSFALIKFLYEVIDIIQGFFLYRVNNFISASDLINMDFGYKDFVGYRLYGPTYDESTFITVLLTKLTALSYYIMAGVLLVRKVILWFFIIISPVFPLLLFYPTIRNTAKIWAGEFFRWLLYAPVFAILLSGLVSFWESYGTLSGSGEALYPTATNILLGAPGQNVSQSNSINQPDTFILYIISLLMIWVVIILPFILLRVFLDYVSNVSFSENSYIKKLISSNFPYLGEYGIIKGSPIPPAIPPAAPTPFGMAKKLPFVNKLYGSYQTPKPPTPIEPPPISGRPAGQYFSNSQNLFTKQIRTTQQSLDKTKDILRSINVNVPTIRDIARYDTSLLSSDTKKHEETTNIIQKLEKIVNPLSTTSSQENHQFNAVRDQLVKESTNNNSFASLILQAASKVVEQKQRVQISEKIKQIAVPSISKTFQEREQYSALRSQLVKESTNNNSFATSILSYADNVSLSSVSKEKQVEITSTVMEKLNSEKQKGNPLANIILSAISPAKTAAVQGNTASSPAKQTALPVINRVQTVSLDDYEAVKEMWIENYKKLDAPVSISGSQKGRLDWIKEEMAKITETIGLLTSQDLRNVEKGMQLVGNILPFLLIGGFSQTEIIAYLKAKLQAGKTVLDEMNIKQEEEETTVEIQKAVDEKPKEMTAETAIEENKKTIDNGK